METQFAVIEKSEGIEAADAARFGEEESRSFQRVAQNS